MKHQLRKSTNALCFLWAFLLFMLHFNNAEAQNANSFSSYVPYSGKYSYGVNQGYYSAAWTDQNLGAIAMGSTAAGVRGVGVKSFRIPLYDDFLTQWGIGAELSNFQYYASLGGGEMTAFVGSPSAAHRYDTTFSGSPEPTKIFANLYQPIWLDAAKTQINPNNYFAKYLYDVARTYGSYVKFWEIVNEPDFTSTSAGWSGDMNPPGSDSWFYHNPTAAELENLRAPIYYYIRMMRVAWEVIKTVSPQSYVCTGGIGYRGFLDAMLRNTDNPVDGSVTADYPAKGGAYFDVVSFHCYPQYWLSNWSNAAGSMVYYRHSDAAANAVINMKSSLDNNLANYGYNGTQYPQKQYILTETGVSRVMDGTNWGSVDGQKNYIIKAQVAFQKAGVRQSYWYRLGDGTTNNQFDQMGMYSYFGNSSPYSGLNVTNEGIAMKTTSDQLYGKTYDASRTSMLSLPSNVDGAAFRANDGTYTYVLWAKTTVDLSETASATYSLPAVAGAGSLTRMEWDYSKTSQSTVVGSTNIPLTGSPSFFSVSGASTPGTSTYTLIPAKLEAENYASMNAVKTEPTTDAGGGLDVGYINPGSWMDYALNAPAAGSYTISLRVASPMAGNQFQLKNALGTVLATVTVPNTGGYQSWQTVNAVVTLPQGQQLLRLYSNSSNWNLNWLQFANGGTAVPVPSPAPTPTTTGTTLHIEAENYTSMNNVQKETTTDVGGGLDVGYINTGSWMQYSVSAPAAGTYTMNFRVATPASNAQFQVKSASGAILATVNVPNTGGYQTWKTITATVNLAAGQQTIQLYSTSPQWNSWNINWLEVVGAGTSAVTTTVGSTIHVEAENYTSMNSVQTESTTDVGGGQDVGYINTSSWMKYSINPTATGSYKFSFRVATPAGHAQFQLRDSAGNILGTVNVPNTGGYQTWQTITDTVKLAAGQQTIQVYSVSPQWNNWNLNWFELAIPGAATASSTSSLATDSTVTVPMSVSPAITTGNFLLMVSNNLTGRMDVQIINSAGSIVKDLPLTKDVAGTTQNYLSIADLAAGTYTVKVTMETWSSAAQITKQ